MLQIVAKVIKRFHVFFRLFSLKVWVKVKKPLLDEYFPPCEVYVSNNLIADLKRAIKKQLGAPQTIAVHAPDLKYSIGIPIKAAFTLE